MVGIAVARDRKVIWANLAYELMFGYSKQEWMGMPTRPLYLNEEDYVEVGEAYANIKDSGVVRKLFAFVRKDGKQIWVNLSGTMLNHGLDESLWIFVDVTEQKQAELAAIEARNLLETIIETAPIRIFWKDTDSRYLGCNTAFCQRCWTIFSEDIIGKNDFEMTWASQADLYRNDDLNFIKSGLAKIAYDEPQQTPNGQTIWLRTSKTPIKNNNVTTGGFLAYMILLSASWLRMSCVLLPLRLNLKEGMMITDANANVLRVNRAFTNITGYTIDEIVGKNQEILSSGNHGTSFYEAMWKSINEEVFGKGTFGISVKAARSTLSI